MCESAERMWRVGPKGHVCVCVWYLIVSVLSESPWRSWSLTSAKNCLVPSSDGLPPSTGLEEEGDN